MVINQSSTGEVVGAKFWIRSWLVENQYLRRNVSLFLDSLRSRSVQSSWERMERVNDP